MINHPILHPTMTDEDLKRECEIALKYDVASVCVKPSVNLPYSYMHKSPQL